MPGFYFYSDLANHYERTIYVAASVIALTLAGTHTAFKVPLPFAGLLTLLMAGL